MPGHNDHDFSMKSLQWGIQLAHTFLVQFVNISKVTLVVSGRVWGSECLASCIPVKQCQGKMQARDLNVSCTSISRVVLLFWMCRCIHLSNNSIQKHYKNGVRAEELPEDNMWHCNEFKEYLKSVVFLRLSGFIYVNSSFRV